MGGWGWVLVVPQNQALGCGQPCRGQPHFLHVSAIYIISPSVHCITACHLEFPAKSNFPAIKGIHHPHCIAYLFTIGYPLFPQLESPIDPRHYFARLSPCQTLHSLPSKLPLLASIH